MEPNPYEAPKYCYVQHRRPLHEPSAILYFVAVVEGSLVSLLMLVAGLVLREGPSSTIHLAIALTPFAVCCAATFVFWVFWVRRVAQWLIG